MIPNDSQHVIIPTVRANVAKGTTISTDQHGAYKPLGHIGYTHERVNHNLDEWVRGIHHTNTLEGFWSHLKRGIRATHCSVSGQRIFRSTLTSLLSVTTTGKRPPKCSKG